MSEDKKIRIKAGEVIIAENCRKVHGKEGAFDEAVKRLKKHYIMAVAHDCNDAADFRIVMTLERKKEAV